MFKIVVFLIILKGHRSLSATVDLTIADGPIQGLLKTTARNNIPYHAYRGIPFAQPPIGDLRFAAPQKNSAWTGTLDATADKSECTTYRDYIGTTVYGAEDCLYINVYTPITDASNTTKLPVLVWIYGGAFLFGNSTFEAFGPENFIETQNLVFVSFNYRLGVFGYLSTGDAACPGNWGNKDQVLALKWVQTNIGYFGGDPNNVTIFGESAGSASVSLLLQTNETTGLFHKAIMNSGTTLNLWSLNTRALDVAQLIGTINGITTTNTTILIEALRNIDASVLHTTAMDAAFTLFLTNGLRGLPYAPVLEPSTVTGALFTNPSDDALVAGKFHQVPILMGINSNEGASFHGIPAILKLYLLNYDVLNQYLTPYSMTSDDATRLSVGQQIKYHYFGLLPITLNNDTLDQFVSDDQFNRPIRRAAVDMSNYVNVYFYQFGYECCSHTYPGVAHAEDLDYLFSSGTQTGTAVSNNLVKLWSNFAISGNPTPQADSTLNNTIWLPIDPSSSDLRYLAINASISMQVNPKQSGWTYYKSLFTTYGDNSYTTY